MPGWELILYILPVQRHLLSSIESKWIKRLLPMVNATIKMDEKSKDQVEDAYKLYFETFFNRRTQNGSFAI